MEWELYQEQIQKIICFQLEYHIINSQQHLDNNSMQEARYSVPLSNQVQLSKSESCFGYLGQLLKKYNPCLRPEKQSDYLSKFLSDYKEISLFEDPYFGQVFLLQSLSKNYEVLLKKQKLTEADAQERQKQIKQFQAFRNNPNILSVHKVDSIVKTGFLWTQIIIYNAYDFIVFDLQKQFEYRLSKGTKFTQNEINSIIRGACKGYIGLQPTDYSSIRMSYIYFNRQGVIKIAHPNLFRYKTNLQTICEHDESKGIYLSPQEMYCLQKGQKDAIMGWKSNSFVFGMVLLSLMSQSHLNQVYDYSACYIDWAKVQQLLRNCKKHYPDKTVNLIEKLIEERAEDRLTFQSLLNKLSNSVDTRNAVELELLNQEIKQTQAYTNYEKIGSHKQPQYTNYLAGLVFPKIGRAGEFYNESLEDNSYKRNRIFNKEQNIIAYQRHYYEGTKSNYIGQAKTVAEKGIFGNNNKLERQGKGYYQNEDGQLYIGDWRKGQMEGYGKLYWEDKKIRYEGQFRAGKFDGRGIMYNGGAKYQGKADQDDEPDHTFVRMQKDNWQKYDGSFVNDLRQGQGIVYFRTGKWIGNFKGGQPNGHGVFIDNTGKQFKGKWENGILK